MLGVGLLGTKHFEAEICKRGAVISAISRASRAKVGLGEYSKYYPTYTKPLNH